ncbi:zinc transporter ZupT, partial [Candidatus Riflebacteria bacterium]
EKNTGFLASALGFSAGVMIYVSFFEILRKARESLVFELGTINGEWALVLSFFLGIIIMAILDELLPNSTNTMEIKSLKSGSKSKKGTINKKKLMRVGIYTTLAIAIHNFPEGIATFTAGLKEVSIGATMALAIGIHNIPEGMVIAIPIFFATGNRKVAFLFTLFAGLAQPAAAILCYFFLLNYLSNVLFGIIFSIAGGIMVFISMNELLPCAMEYGENHQVIYGLISGMVLMAIIFLIFI